MSIQLTLHNQQAEEIGKIELSEKIFQVKENKDLIHQVYNAQISNERQVLAHTKNRAEVRGGGRKPWKQKGTGRARAGSSRSPIWRGGGVTFGPRSDRNFDKKINIKMKRKAICMLMSDRVKNESFLVLDKIEFDEFKTKKALNIVEKLFKLEKKSKKNILVINDNKDIKSKNSFANLVGVKIINSENINIADLLKHQKIVITKPAVEKIELKYNNK